MRSETSPITPTEAVTPPENANTSSTASVKAQIDALMGACFHSQTNGRHVHFPKARAMQNGRLRHPTAGCSGTREPLATH